MMLHCVQLPGRFYRVIPSSNAPPSDKREALKWHNRRAIVDAAARLARHKGLQGFTVNDLAEAAGVSRRTVFNHFSGVEEAVQASFLDAIEGLYADFHASIGDARFPDLPTAFHKFVEAAAALDVVGTVCQAIVPLLPEGYPPNPTENSTRVVTSPGDSAACLSSASPGGTGPVAVNASAEVATETDLLAVRATDAAVRELVALLHNRVENADPFDSHLLGECLVTTITVCAQRWFTATHGELTDETRALWQNLLSRGMTSLGRGFAA